MNSELKELIACYEQEIKDLNCLIDEFVKDRDFKMAQRNQKSLKLIQRTISVLKKLDNPRYSEIRQLQFQLDNMNSKHFLKLVEDTRMAAFRETQIESLKNRLNLLLNVPASAQIDAQEFDDFIFMMVERKISHFKLSINRKYNNLSLDFVKSNHHIIIYIFEYKKLKKDELINKNVKSALKKIGFNRNKEEDSLFLKYDLSQFKNALGIKEITSRIIYEAFDGYADQTSFLEIVN